MKALATSPKGKAPGLDDIPIELLTFLRGDNLQLLLHTMNECLPTSTIPNTWTTAKAVSIFKKGDARLPENYRPISLLSSLYKIYAKLLLNRIQGPVDKVLRPTQYGCRPSRSTSDPIHILRRVQELFETSDAPLHLLFIDWKMAFDKVSHAALQSALTRIGIPTVLVNAIMSMRSWLQTTVEHPHLKEPGLGSDKDAPSPPFSLSSFSTVSSRTPTNSSSRKVFTPTYSHPAGRSTT